MSKQSRAAKVIKFASARGYGPEQIATLLNELELLAPDLPERPDGGIWGDLGQFLVDTAENGGVAVAPPHPGVVTLDSKEARETAHALLAAAQYAEEEA